MVRLNVAVLVGVLVALALAGCGGAGSAFDEVQQVAGIQRGTPTLIFVYTDG